jgi:hypothetical protein
MPASTVGDTADGVSSRTGRIIASLPREALRAASAWEVSAHPITLAIGWLADTLGGVCLRRWCVAPIARKIARTLDTTEGTGVWWVVAFLATLLAPDL